MDQLDSIRLSETVRQRLVDFAIDDSFVQDLRLVQILRQLWGGPAQEGGLVGDLWVEGAFPAETAEETLESLVNQGRFSRSLCRQLSRRGVFPSDRPLYRHQLQSIEQAPPVRGNGCRPSLVVTAGTGAGKTESFLLPILNDLFSQPVSERRGVQCLILYPMNALVNDQVDRLHDWLLGQDRVTLFHFTGETPEDRKRADQDGIPPADSCRFRTRLHARGLETADGEEVPPEQRGPVPDILITNYSMLEYMLCRPQDAVFFGHGLRALVLDEAHLYTGTLAAEITLLLRRLYARCGLSPNQILQIATSATIGTGRAGELDDFASTLFTKDRSLVQVIAGRPRKAGLPPVRPPSRQPRAEEVADATWLERPTICMERDGSPVLAMDSEACERLSSSLPILVDAAAVANATSECDEKPARLLHGALGAAPLLHETEELLWERKRMPLPELAEALWGTAGPQAIQATIGLLQMGAAARCNPGEYPLLPHRLHLVARATDGLVACLNRECSGEAELKLPGLGVVSTGYQNHCPRCRGVTLSLSRCTNCGEWVLAGIYRDARMEAVPPARGTGAPTTHYLALGEARPGPDGAPSATTFAIDPVTGQRRAAGTAGIKVHKCSACPRCGREDAGGWQPFTSSWNLTLSILAESVLTELPPYAAPHNLWLPARGRRLLAFSDSRQDAARLGLRLTRQHEMQLVRAGLARCVAQSQMTDEADLADLTSEIQRVEVDLAGALTEAQRQRRETRLEELRQQLAEAEAGGALEDWIRLLEKCVSVHEILDPSQTDRHGPAEWMKSAQKAWERNWERVRERLPFLTKSELVRPFRGAVSPETLGLVEVTYPDLERLQAPRELLGKLPTEDARTSLRECWPHLLAALCDTLRVDGAVTLGSEEEDADYQPGGAPTGLWCAAEPSSEESLVRFAGATKRQRRRRFVQEVLSRCGLPPDQARDQARDLLLLAFEQLRAAVGGTLPWLETEQRQSSDGPAPAIRIRFPRLGLRRPARLYRCPTTGYVWVREVLGCAPEPGCNSLEPTTEAELDAAPRVGRQRREFKDSQVFQLGLWAEEHSAQLSPKENRGLQDLFKLGARNILSSTTTLELGIDIGGLSAVLMSNVPPGKANYLQRAGRAGRRADGSSVVVTFARPRPFDREVFLDFGKYLDRDLRRPRVLLDRERIARRHCHSFLLGEFFRAVYPPGYRVGAMNAFGDMGRFCGVPLPLRWDQGDRPPTPPIRPDWTAPDVPWWNRARREPGLEAQFFEYLYWVREFGERELRPLLEDLCRNTGMEVRLDDWPALLDQILEDCDEAIRTWKQDYDNLWSAWLDIEDNSPFARRQANAIRYQMASLYEVTVIEALADRQFLPRYGFPIGVQRLRVLTPDERRQGRTREEDQFRLERSGLLALREYVPGSRLLVGGRLVTSRGLLKHWTGANLDNYFGVSGQYTHCANNHFYYEISAALGECPICGAPPRESSHALLLPRHGFSTAAWDPPRRSTDVEGVGHTERATIAFAPGRTDGPTEVWESFAGIPGLRAYYREDGELLVYNLGEARLGFAICTRCGYADSEVQGGNGRTGLPARFLNHLPLHQPLTSGGRRPRHCWGERGAPVLRHRTLAARETTDILMLDFAGCVGPVGADEALIQTLAQALQVAGAKRLEVDSRELGVLVAPAGEAGQSLGAVLYDNTAGGSGHVLELAMAGGDWLRDAREALVVSPAHHERCETACLDCLLTFDAQEAMGKGLLQRRRAFKALDVLLGNGSLPQPTRVPDSAPPTQAPPSTPSVPSDAEAARRRRFEARAALLAAEE